MIFKIFYLLNNILGIQSKVKYIIKQFNEIDEFKEEL